MAGLLRKLSYNIRDIQYKKPLQIFAQKCSSYSLRTHTCGELSLGHEGERVTIAGWVQAKRLDKFVLLRDRTGVCQVKIPDENNLFDHVKKVPNESVLVLNGIVKTKLIDTKPPRREIPVYFLQLFALKGKTCRFIL